MRQDLHLRLMLACQARERVSLLAGNHNWVLQFIREDQLVGPAPEPRLSVAGNRFRRQLAPLLEQLVRMESGLSQRIRSLPCSLALPPARSID